MMTIEIIKEHTYDIPIECGSFTLIGETDMNYQCDKFIRAVVNQHANMLSVVRDIENYLYGGSGELSLNDTADLNIYCQNCNGEYTVPIAKYKIYYGFSELLGQYTCRDEKVGKLNITFGYGGFTFDLYLPNEFYEQECQSKGIEPIEPPDPKLERTKTRPLESYNEMEKVGLHIGQIYELFDKKRNKASHIAMLTGVYTIPDNNEFCACFAGFHDGLLRLSVAYNDWLFRKLDAEVWHRFEIEA